MGGRGVRRRGFSAAMNPQRNPNFAAGRPAHALFLDYFPFSAFPGHAFSHFLQS